MEILFLFQGFFFLSHLQLIDKTQQKSNKFFLQVFFLSNVNSKKKYLKVQKQFSKNWRNRAINLILCHKTFKMHVESVNFKTNC